MKRMKKLASLLLAMVMVLSMTVAAFAVEHATPAGTGEFSITLKGKTTGHTYKAYQIFKGDLLERDFTQDKETADANKVLSNIEWGTGVNATADLLTDLSEITIDDNSPFANVKNLDVNAAAAEVAKILSEQTNTEKEDSAIAIEFAKVMGNYLTSKSSSSDSGTKDDNTKEVTYVIENLNAGYYLVKDDGTVNNQEDAYTRYIMKVVSDVTANVKVDIPTIEKHIGSESDKKLGTSVNVGDTVPFILESSVPDTTGYESYEYIIHDTLSSGLTFNVDSQDINKSVVAKIDGKSVNVTVEHNNGALKIVFPNFITASNDDFGTDFDKTTNLVKGKTIVVTYSATLNASALSTDVENNKVYLEYSSNPYDDSVKNRTPDKETYVYNFDIEIDKYTKSTSENIKLPDAKFVLYKDSSTAGKKDYYFQNLTTKEVSWTSLTDEELKDELKKASKEITEVTTDAKGNAKFEGLAAGTYYLLETVAPNGYNKLKAPVTITITADYNKDGTLKTTNNNDNADKAFEDKNVNTGITVEHKKDTDEKEMGYSLIAGIENNAGATLPSTGGIGTTIFYAAGIILMAGAVFFVVRRKRA